MARGYRGEDHPLAASCYHHRPSQTLPLRRHIRPRGITSFFRGHVRAYYSVVSSTWRTSLSTIQRDRWLHPENVETRVWRKRCTTQHQQPCIWCHAYFTRSDSNWLLVKWIRHALCNVDFYEKKKLKMLSLVISEEGRVQAGGDGKGHHQGAQLWKGKDGTNRQAGKILIEEYFFIPCL